jgi:uncharacterized protein (TIGR00255 family)
MITSMTGFARLAKTYTDGELIFEIRSLNHRYLDLHFSLPEAFRDLELPFKQLVKKHIFRGKIEVSLRYTPSMQAQHSFEINQALVTALINTVNQVSQELPHPANINPFDILTFPGVTSKTNLEKSAIKEEALSLFQDTLMQLNGMRQDEGRFLQQFLIDKINEIQAHLQEIHHQLPTILDKNKQKLYSLFNELKGDILSERLEKELVTMLQKYDVAEELSRMSAHIEEILRTLSGKDSIGRRIDFLLQELNREANTLSAKAADKSITYVALECKVIIEQMREQTQNIE